MPDAHDYTVRHSEVRRLISDLERLRKMPEYVDWREYCEGVDDQSSFNTSAANACVGLLQYYERRASGRIIEPSRMFVYKTSSSLIELQPGITGSIYEQRGKRLSDSAPPPNEFGRLNRKIWMSNQTLLPTLSTNDSLPIRYVRLDVVGNSGDDNLRSVKAFLAAGFASVFGFPVHDSIRQDPDIDFPSTYDTAIGGQAVMAVGYDDNRSLSV